MKWKKENKSKVESHSEGSDNEDGERNRKTQETN
jgi:hypothetical protein